MYQQWGANARLSGKVPGGQLKSLTQATSNSVRYHKEDKRTQQLADLLKPMDVTRDWSREAAIKLLDEVTDVCGSLPEWGYDISRVSISDGINTGKPLPNDLNGAPWGEAHESGLRLIRVSGFLQSRKSNTRRAR